MEEKKDKPTLMDTAGWMALPIGFMWSASFLCAMYGIERPLLSMLGTALGFISIYTLYKQLTNYRRLHPSTWLHILCLSFLTCLLAGLLTDAVQYAYFILLDNGRFLSMLGTALQSEENRQVWQQMMPGLEMEEALKMIQSMTIRDIMLQLAFSNVMLALPVSLLAALPVRKAKSEG